MAVSEAGITRRETFGAFMSDTTHRWIRIVKHRPVFLALNLGGAALIAIAALAHMKGDAFPLVPASASLQSLENAAATQPNAENVAALATGYLAAKQPGMARAVLERNAEVRSPELALVRSEAYFAAGDAPRALSEADALESSCAKLADACPAWISAKVTTEAAFLREVVRAGITDPAEDPAGTQAAFQRSRVEAKMVAIE